MLRPALALLALLATAPLRSAAAPAPEAATAQTTGELRTPRFRIVYTPRAAGAARPLGDELERARDDVARALGGDWPGVPEVRVGNGREEFEALALPGGAPARWAVAQAYPERNIILVEARSLVTAEGQEILRHELAHVALGQLGRGWPRWFHEGLAMHVAGEHRITWPRTNPLFRAAQGERLLPLDQLTSAWPDHAVEAELAYAESADFVATLAARHGTAKLRAVIDAVQGGEPFELAFAKVLGASVRHEEELWKKELARRSSWVPLWVDGPGLWALLGGLCVIGYLRRRAYVARLRAQQAAEEALMELSEEEEEEEEEQEPETEQEPTIH